VNEANSSQQKLPEDKEAPVTKQPETSNQQPATQNMETHAHHLHKVPGQGWKHYLFEFLMLFLAVTAGFFVENVREHLVEHQREKQFIRSMVIDLERDKKALDSVVTSLNRNHARLDTLIRLLSDPQVKEYGPDLYYFGKWATRNSRFPINDRTIQQMKNSGGFRLIRNDIASDAIVSYYNRMNVIELLQNIDYDNQFEYKRIAIEVFNPTVFESMLSAENNISRPAGNPALLTYDPKYLVRLAGTVSYMKTARLGLALQDKKMREAAEDLILLLKKEYHLQ